MEYTHPFLFKIVTILIYNKLFVLLLYKVNIKQTFFLLLVTK
ncbi:putative membrane protein [Bacteroides fragilis str. 1007-1-F |uniref:Membrane protein n=1 Tax=Bacteroides fragilis str. 1007-1-F \|nr:putative membrane protein [Bacteroides fragilis str. 1007-1-F \